MSVALHHRLEGPAGAPVVVLSNSLGTTLAMWDDQAAALAERFRVLRYDHRGHGGSPAPRGPYTITDLGGDLLALLDRLELERVSLCGVSLGGMVGMWLASEAPERVDRLVLSSTSALLGPPEFWTERAAAVRAGGMQAVAATVLERWFTPGFRAAAPAAVDRIGRMLLETPPEGYAACCDAIRALDLRERLASIRAGTLVIAGADDPATPPEHGSAIADAIEGADLVVLARAAHLANVERSGAVTGLILAHLGRLEGDRHRRGMEVRRAVLGDEHVDAAVARTSDLTAEFQDLITRYAWGEIWTRPGLDRRTRSAITLTALVALGHEGELAMHVRAALRNGLTRAEVKEVLLQAAIYCGVPAANSAFAVAQRVLDELDSSGRAGGRDVEAAPVVAQRGVDHVGITVPDLEEATAFFVEVLGCVVLYEHPGSDLARAYARLGAEPGAHPRRVRMLRCANSANIELFEWEAPRQRTDFPRPSDQAIQHVAIYVEDVDAAAQALREHGVEVLAGPNPLPGPEGGAGNRFVYTRTPWGMTLELISYPSPLTYPAEVSATRWVPAPRGF